MDSVLDLGPLAWIVGSEMSAWGWPMGGARGIGERMPGGNASGLGSEGGAEYWLRRTASMMSPSEMPRDLAELLRPTGSPS